MNPQPTIRAAMSNSASQSSGHFQFYGKALTLARVVWVLISLAAVSLLITALVWNTVAWWHVTLASCPEAACRSNAPSSAPPDE